MIPFGNILGGVNYTYPPTDMPMFYLADANNVIPVLNGYGAKRGGSANYLQYGTGLITSFHELINTTATYLLAASGTSIGISTNGGAFSSHITSLTDSYGQWLNYNQYAIYANGNQPLKRTDGTTAANLTTDIDLTGASCVCEFGERVWTAVGATLYASALRAPTDFSTTGSAGYYSGTVGNTNQAVTGLFSFIDLFLIGKLNQIYQLTGAPETDTETFRLTPLQTKDKDSFGFTSKNAITQVGNDLLFLDGFNIKRLSGITQYGDVESLTIIGNIKDFFRDSSGAGLNKDYLDRACFIHYKHKEQIYCSIPTGANTRYWFVIDYSNRELRNALELPQYSFYPMSGLTPISFGGMENGSRVDIYAGCEDGWIKQLDTGTNDISTAIDSHMTWVWGDAERLIQPMGVVLNIKGSDIIFTPSYAMGLQDWEGLIDSSNFTDLALEGAGGEGWRKSGNVSYKKLSSFMYHTGRTFAFKIRHNTKSQTIEMRKSMFDFQKKQVYAG